jgi:hypothetical protein
MNEISRRLVLRYDPGQFTFRHFLPTATDAELYGIARAVNEFQEDEVKQIVRVQVFSLN